jgi:hypothetical protein
MLVVPVDELNVRVIRASSLTVPGTIGKLDLLAH